MHMSLFRKMCLLFLDTLIPAMVTELKINSRKIQNCTTSTDLFNFRTFVLNHFHGINAGQGQNKLPITLTRFNTLLRVSLANY